MGLQLWITSHTCKLGLNHYFSKEHFKNYLCSKKEHVISHMLSFTGNHSQCHTRKYVGIVSLARYEMTTISESNRSKWTTTGKHSFTLPTAGILNQLNFLLFIPGFSMEPFNNPLWSKISPPLPSFTMKGNNNTLYMHNHKTPTNKHISIQIKDSFCQTILISNICVRSSLFRFCK